jgi:hypothetical protein
MWPTVRANEHGAYQYDNHDKTKPRLTLTGMARKHPFPTPTGQDAKNDGGPSQHDRNSVPLNLFVKMYPTPRTPSPTGGGTGLDGGAGARAMMTEKDRKELTGGQLNPVWVAWLMGWPIGWTDLKRLEMDKFRPWLRRHGVSCSVIWRASRQVPLRVRRNEDDYVYYPPGVQRLRDDVRRTIRDIGDDL